MTTYILSAFVFIFLGAIFIFLPVSWGTNIYFVNSFLPELIFSGIGIFFAFIGIFCGLFMSYIRDWLLIIGGLLFEQNDNPRKKNNAIFHLITLSLIVCFSLFMGFLVLYTSMNFIDSKYLPLVTLIGLLINLWMLKIIAGIGVEKKIDHFRLRFPIFIFIGLFSIFGYLPGIAWIVPMVFIFRIFGISLFQSLRYTMLSLTIILGIILCATGFIMDFSELLYPAAYFAITLVAFFSSLLIISWFRIFTSDSVQVYKFFKTFTLIQIIILFLWFL